jgi:hypothetical protein
MKQFDGRGNAMQENLLSPTNITLFGRVFPLAVDAANLPDTLGGNRFLREQLAHLDAAGNPDARFARIFAISYEGKFYTLSAPAIFLVHGEGTEIHDAGLPNRGAGVGGQTDDSGLIAKSFNFERSLGPGGGGGGGNPALVAGEAVVYWEYDKGDFSLRMEIASGTFEEILLGAEVESQLQISGAARMQAGGAARMQTGAARMQVSHAARMQVGGRKDD